MPAVPPYIIEPIWEQFSALLPKRDVDHPLGCHRARIPDGAVFEKLVEVLVFGCAYKRRSPRRDARPRRSGAAVTSGSGPGRSTPCGRWRSKPTIG